MTHVANGCGWYEEKKISVEIWGKNLIEVSSKMSENGKLKKILCDEKRRIGRQTEANFALGLSYVGNWQLIPME